MKSKITIISIALLIATIAAAANTALLTGPLIMAHRGGLFEADENTLKAYNIAIDRGVDIIECDPKITKDAKWIIMHDLTVERTTNGVGKISDMTFDQIRNLRTKGGETIPTFDEVLDLGKNRNVMIFVDVHVPPPNLDAFLAIIDAHGMAGRIVINPWIKPFQIELKKKRPEIATCFPYPKPIPSLRKLKELGVDYVGTLPVFATKHMIRKCHKLGMKVVTMPINEKGKILKFAAKGLDIIQTDDPRITEKLFSAASPATSRLKLAPSYF